jgi:HAD superfamily phosphatase (TIGR01668 family)
MLKQFYPASRKESTYEIPFEELYRQGIRGVIFDVDNTLVPHDAPADTRAKELFKRLREIGLESCLASNNKEPRVKKFAQAVGTKYIYKAGKPKRRGYKEAMKQMGTRAENTVFVGDQIFTDIWGANRAGITSILVKPINPKEEIQIVIKRVPEKLVLYFYERTIEK